MAMNAVDRQHYNVDNPKVSVLEIESILDIISFANEDSLRRMIRHAKFSEMLIHSVVLF